MRTYTRPKPLRLPSSPLKLHGDRQTPWRTDPSQNHALLAFDDAFTASITSATSLIGPSFLHSPPLPTTSSLNAQLAAFTFPPRNHLTACASPTPPTSQARPLRRRRSTLGSPRPQQPAPPLTPLLARRPSLATSTLTAASAAAARERRRRQQRDLLIAAEDPSAQTGLQLLDSYLGLAGKERYKAQQGGYAVLGLDKKRWKREPETMRLLEPGQRSSVYMLRSTSYDSDVPPRGAPSAPPSRSYRKRRPPPLDLGSLSSFSSSANSSVVSLSPAALPRIKRSRAANVAAPPLPGQEERYEGDPIAREVARRQQLQQSKAVSKKPSLASMVVRRIKSLHKLGGGGGH